MNHVIICWLLLLAFGSPSIRAEDLNFYLAASDVREVSKESLVRTRLDAEDNDRESISVIVYKPGKLLRTAKAVVADLQKVYNAAKTARDAGPFFAGVDCYLVRDTKGRWFLLQFEYRRPGDERHLNRFRIGQLRRITDGVDAFFLVDFTQVAATKSLTLIMEQLADVKEVQKQRHQ